MKDEFYTVRGYELQNNQRKITPSMEDYIEMIYRNSLNEESIRINQLSKLLNVRNSSVSKMVQKLNNLELLNYEKYGAISLSNKGIKLGTYLLKRHTIIENFLNLLGCSENVLAQTELIEHIIEDNTVNKIEILVAFFINNKEIFNQYTEYKKRIIEK